MESKEIIDFLKTHRDTAVSGDALREYPASLVEYLKREGLIFDPFPGAPPFPLHRWCVSEKGKQAIMEADEHKRGASRESRRDIVSYATLAASLISAAASLLK